MNVTPNTMPKKLPDGLVKLKREDVEVARVPYDLYGHLDAKSERKERKEERKSNVARALHGSPLHEEVKKQEHNQKRATKKRQAIGRINRKRRPKKR